jgi:serine protease Do
VNQWAFAAGNPFGLANNSGRLSVTFGVVSALGRQLTRRLARDSELQYYGNLIETSAAINPGNSGGPLFNIEGEVIGVVTAIETSSGVNEGQGFAIPIDRHTRRILDTLKAGQPVHYGFLGVKVEDAGLRRDRGGVFNPGRAREEAERNGSRIVASPRTYHGAAIVGITFAAGPAASAGLRAKDVIIEFDGGLKTLITSSAWCSSHLPEPRPPSLIYAARSNARLRSPWATGRRCTTSHENHLPQVMFRSRDRKVVRKRS